MAKGDASDPTWQYITAALTRARAHAKAKGYTWNGESCFVVSGFALGLVMDTRNSKGRWMGGAMAGDGGPTLATKNPRCIELAYADHYFNARLMSGAAYVAGGAVAAIDAYGYDAYKLLILWMMNQRMPTPALAPGLTPGGGWWDPTTSMPDPARAAMFVTSLFCNAIADAGDRWERSRRENPGVAMSAPTPEGRYWALQGAQDGVSDIALNPLQFADLVRRTK